MDVQRFDLTSQSFKNDPFPTLDAMLDAGPVVKTTLPFLGRTWIATSYAAVCDVLRESHHFVREAKSVGKRREAGMRWWMPRTFRSLANNMLTKDEPDHRRLRALVERAFVKSSVDEMQPRIEQLADELLCDLHDSYQREGRVDFHDAFARQLPLAVICDMLGLPAEDRPKFTRWASGLSKATSLFSLVGAARGIFKIQRYLEQQFELCRRKPRDGLLSALVEVEDGGDRLSEEELAAMGFLLLFAGHETTTHLISNSVLTLLDHPQSTDRLLADWSLVESCVDEVLRYNSPVQMTKPRFVKQDVRFHGVDLRRGELIVAILASANCDPAEFPNPHRFDIGRAPNRHLTFGSGIHVCLGLKLAKAEAEVTLQMLYSRYPELSLAVPRSEIRWLERIGMRPLRSLPLKLRA